MPPPMLPPQLMPAHLVKEILLGMERRGEIPHDWRETWPWYKQVATAHRLAPEQAAALWETTSRAYEWQGAGEEFGGPLKGGAAAWYAREPGQAPTPMRTMTQITGLVETPEGVMVGTSAAKALKRTRLAAQEYGLPVDRPPVTSWLRPPGGEPTRGAEVMTAFTGGLPPGAGAVSPAFPEIAKPYTRRIPIDPQAQITAVARPGAWAQRGGALELLRTTQGITRQPVKDWERLELTGKPKIVPYRSEGRPEITEAWEFPMTRYAPTQAGMWSQKAGGVKAFMGTGYDPQEMFGAGVEQILPWPKETRQFYAHALGTEYGKKWFQERYPETEIPTGGLQWGQGIDPQIMEAGERFVQEHTQMRRFTMPVHEAYLGERKGGGWGEKWGPYWQHMPKGPLGRTLEPTAMGGGRWSVQQERAVMEAPFLSQYRREHAGRPFVSAEELAQLSVSRPKVAERLWQEGARERQPYTEMFRAMAVTRSRQVMGPRIEDLPWGRIQERGRAIMEEELDWVPKGQRVPGQYLSRAAAEIAPGPVRATYGSRELQLPGAETFERLGVPGPLGEEVTPMMTAWHRLSEQAAMAVGPGGAETGEPGAMRRATRQLWLAMKRFGAGAGVQREVLGTRPQGAWEGPILSHTALAPGERMYGDIALGEMAGARTEEEALSLRQRLGAAAGRGIATLGWRRPVSDPQGQMGGQAAQVLTEEMGRERGMAVAGLGRGAMASMPTLWEQRGDVDADRLIDVMEQKLSWVRGKPVLGALQPGIERGIGTLRRIAGGLRRHAPEQTPAGGTMQQIFGSTAEWNEARAWAEEVGEMGTPEQVMERFQESRGQMATWGQLGESAQAGLVAKEAMGRTYNRMIRELRPLMTGTAAGRRAYSQVAAGPYQRTIDVQQLSPGMRKYLAMQETLSMTPKGGGFGFAEVFSPYEKTETGELRPRMSKMRGWGDIGVQATGAMMGMEEVPEEARAYMIGGEKFQKPVLEAMRAGKQPGEILGLMGGTEREAMAAAGPGMQATLRRLYSKMPEGEQSYVDYQGKERTVQMPLHEDLPPEAAGIRGRGQEVRQMLKLMGRRGFRQVAGVEQQLSFTPKQFEQVLTGGISGVTTPEQQQVLGRAAQEMGMGGPRAEPETPHERIVRQQEPVVTAWNGMMQQEIRAKFAARAPGGMGPVTPYRQVGAGPASLAQQALGRLGGMEGLRGEVRRIQEWRAQQPGYAPERGTRTALNWMMQQGGGPTDIAEWGKIVQQAGISLTPSEEGAPVHDYGPRVAPPRQFEQVRPEFEQRLQAAMAGGGGAGGGGGGVLPPAAAAQEPGEWRGEMGWRMQQRITRGPGGASFQQWSEPMYATGRHEAALKGVQAGMGRSLPEVQAAAKGVVEEFGKLQERLKEGGALRDDEIKQQKERLQTFKEARRVAQEWERQAEKTYPLTGTEQFAQQRAAVRAQLDPLMQQVEGAQRLVPEIGMRMGGMGGEPPAPGGLRGLLRGMGAGLRGAPRKALGGWGMMYLNRMRSMFITPVQRAMQEYAGQQMATQQAMYAAGIPGGLGGAPADILTGRARMGQFRQGVGEAGWQAWGGMAGMLGGEGGPMAPALAIGAPALGVGLGAAYLAGGPVGLLAGGLTAAAGAISYGAGAMQDREAMAMAAAGAGDFRGEVGLALTGQALPGPAYPGAVGPGVRARPRGPQAPLTPEQQALTAYGQQIMGGNLAALPAAGRGPALQYFAEQQLGPQLPTLDPGQRMQLTGAYMGMTGLQQTGQFNQQLMVTAGQRAQMLGVPMGQAFQPWQQAARQMGFGPGQGMAEQLAEITLQAETVVIDRPAGGVMEAERAPSERDIQRQLWEWQNISPITRQLQQRFGMEIGAEAFQEGGQFAGLGAAGAGPQRWALQQFMGGNRYVASGIGREQGIPGLVTMEAGGLPIGTQEMWGLQDTMRGAQRGYRDWQQQQTQARLQWQRQYTGQMWGIQDQQRALQGQQADWSYGLQQRQFALGGQQWQERFDVSGRQWQESFGLSRQMFEARVGFQQQDMGRREQRAEQQYQWRMEDWGYSENVAQLQAGWRQEDLSEAIRFSSGRQRKKLMEQQERGTIMESMRRQHHESQRERLEEQRSWQEEDFEQSRERNERLIELQRERFDMQLRHHEENRALAQRHHDDTRQLQEERMRKTREFYLQNRKLEDERIKLSRQNWERQQKWAEAAWKKAQAYNKEMDRLQDQYRDLQRSQQRTIANFNRMLNDTDEWLAMIQQAMGTLTETPAQARIRHEVERGHQAGGFVGKTEKAMLHEGEYVVPAGGALVLKGEDKADPKMLQLLERIATACENGQAIIIQSPDAQRAREEILTLEDGAYTLMG